MKVRIISGVIIDGEPRFEGSILEINDTIARQIISSNRAEVYVEPEPQAPAPEPQPEAPAKPATATRGTK